MADIKHSFDISGESNGLNALKEYLAALGVSFEASEINTKEECTMHIDITIPDSMHSVELSRTRGAGRKDSFIHIDAERQRIYKTCITAGMTLTDFLIALDTGNKSDIAEALRISRPTLYKRAAKAHDIIQRHIENGSPDPEPTVMTIGMI